METKALLEVPKDWNVTTIAKHLLSRHPGFCAVDNTDNFSGEIGNGAVRRLGFERTEPTFRHGQYSTIHKAIN
jgi:hypothetical protein